MVKLDYIITNGDIDKETIDAKFEKGWSFVTSISAVSVHPHAMSTDKLTIFSKYEKSNVSNNKTLPLSMIAKEGDPLYIPTHWSEVFYIEYISSTSTLLEFKKRAIDEGYGYISFNGVVSSVYNDANKELCKDTTLIQYK